ncbi:MAG: hypothetical protein ACK4ND_14920, partial [Cytophagaceae bacterium]
ISMKTAGISDIKKQLSELSREELMALCLKLARYKKDNKEFLTYLLYEAEDEESFIRSVKLMVEEEFETVNKSHLYFAKKTIRKILRMLKKYIKYSGKKETEVELLIFFCHQIKESGLKIKESKVLLNMYEQQIKLIYKSLDSMHEDLQYDYGVKVAPLEL